MIIGAGLLLSKRSIAWSYVASGSATGTNPVVPVAAMSPQAGDLIVIVATQLGTYVTPSGYTSVSAYPVFYKIAAGSDADVTLSGVASTTERAACLLYRAISASPLDVVSGVNAGSDVNVIADSLTTTQPNDLLLAIFSQTVGTTTQTWGTVSGMTKRINAGFTTSITGLCIAEKNVPTASATGAITCVIGGGGISWSQSGVQISFKAKYP